MATPQSNLLLLSEEVIMNTENYHFKVGDFECIVVNDGTFAYPHPAAIFFANAPQAQLGPMLQKYNLDIEAWEVYVSPYPSLVINTGQHRVLVDTGAGDFAPTTGKLRQNLKQAGLRPEDIDTVILTHGHLDHIGGAIDAQGKPAFPKARYVMWQAEWDFWNSDPDISSLPIPDQFKQIILASAQKNLPPLQDQLELIDQEVEIVPGVRAVAAPGHTPGHIAVAVSSKGEQLLHLVDTIFHPIHLEQPNWYAAFDLSPEKAIATRYRLLHQAASDKALVLTSHLPAPGLGYVVQKGERWQWQPVEINSPLNL
jgi:glyoxylase-like metal-dependent hydrolase (beta-lactamase superfamily II)